MVAFLVWVLISLSFLCPPYFSPNKVGCKVPCSKLTQIRIQCNRRCFSVSSLSHGSNISSDYVIPFHSPWMGFQQDSKVKTRWRIVSLVSRPATVPPCTSLSPDSSRWASEMLPPIQTMKRCLEFLLWCWDVS